MPDTNIKILSGCHTSDCPKVIQRKLAGCAFGPSCPGIHETESDDLIVVGKHFPITPEIAQHIGKDEYALLVPRQVILEAAQNLKKAENSK